MSSPSPSPSPSSRRTTVRLAAGLVALVVLAAAGWGLGAWVRDDHARGTPAPGTGSTGAPIAPADVVLRPDDRAVLAVGERIYRQHCAACHGADLEGEPNWRDRGPDGRLPAPPHDPSGHTWHHPDAQLFVLTKHGIARGANLPGYDSAMPAYEGVLSDAEIVAVLSWIKSRWPPAIRARHDGVNQAAREAARERR